LGGHLQRHQPAREFALLRQVDTRERAAAQLVEDSEAQKVVADFGQRGTGRGQKVLAARRIGALFRQADGFSHRAALPTKNCGWRFRRCQPDRVAAYFELTTSMLNLPSTRCTGNKGASVSVLAQLWSLIFR